MHHLYERLCARTERTRGLALTWWVRRAGGRVGQNLRIERGLLVRRPPGPGWDIGDNVYLGRSVVLDVKEGAILRIGSKTKVMHFTVLAAEKSIVIHSDVLIAESCSVRDGGHVIDGVLELARSGMHSEDVVLEQGVWIGRGTAVLAGAHVREHAVVGANSVVNGGLAAFSVSVGAPARTIRSRNIAPAVGL